MKRLFVCVSALFCALSICAGPHTIQRGETFADVARLYNISLDTLIIANSNADAFVGLTIEVPLSTLLIDLGDSELFRYLSKNSFSNREKGIRKYKQAYEKQLRLKDTQEKNRLKKKRSQKQSDTEVLTNIHGNRGINDEREHKNI